MAEKYDSDDRNGTVPVEEQDRTSHKSKGVYNMDQTVYETLRRLIAEVFSPDKAKGSSLFQRVKVSITENGPAVEKACRNIGRDVLCWTRRGSPLRALLVISVSITDNSKNGGCLDLFILFEMLSIQYLMDYMS